MIGWRSFILKRVLARFRVGEDVLRHLSTFQRLGESLEATPPGEMLPVGLRTLLRAVRTRGAVQIRPGWIWPFWVEQQISPVSEAFLPRGHLPFMSNMTRRNWTMVGAVDSEWEAIVDERGLLTPWFDGWSLDWWVGTRAGWQFPSREDSVTQALVDSTPVVKTTMPVGSGEVEHLAWCPLQEDTAVVAIRNQTDETLDLALAIRPYNPEGLAVVESLLIDGPTVMLDGRPALFLPETPQRTVVSNFRDGDCASAVEAGSYGPPSSGLVEDHAGMIQAAFVYEVPPGEELRCAIPLSHERRVEKRKRLPKGLVAKIPASNPEEVSLEWKSALSEGMQVALPDRRLQEALDANRAYMLLFHDGEEITPGPYTYHRFWFRDAAYQLAAMTRWGFTDQVEKVISTYASKQRRDGFFYSQWREWDSNGAALWTIAEYYRLTKDRSLVDRLKPSIVKGARWIDGMRNERIHDPNVKGLLPPGVSAEHLGPFDYYYWDNLWCWRGLLDAAYLLDAIGDQKQAESVRSTAVRLQDSFLASLRNASAKIGRSVIPAGPTRGIDAAMIGSLAACYPLNLLRASDPWIQTTAQVIRDEFCLGEAFFQEISHTGLGTYLTLQLAFVELEAGDYRAWERLRWLLDSSTETFTWPEAIHPRLGGGCMGDGHHGWAAADFLSFVRNVLVRESAEGELALLTLLPQEWKGKPIRVQNAPTHFGEVSFEVSWEDGKAILRWEKSSETATVTVPSLSGSWSSRDKQGTVAFDAAPQ
ncbi:MAG: hypothetical protein WD602_07455 [Actinomycetota bacterium]